MKTIKQILLVFFALIVCSSKSLSGTTDELPVVTKAKSTNKNIVVYFSGSDWCSICHVFKNEFIEQKEVTAILNTDFVYYNADFPQRRKLGKEIVANNDLLAAKLNPNGIFPLLVIADENLKIKKVILRTMGYDQSLENLRDNVKK
jgi:thioredoxin-related protein